MANEILASTIGTGDQEKFLAAKIIKRSYLKLVMGSLMDKVSMPKGAGLTANFVRYKRMNVPLTPLTDDGQDPANSTFGIDNVTVSLDEWGDVITITNVAELTIKHPLLEQATKLLADNAARVMDREITIVLMAGTNIQYGVGTATSRGGTSGTGAGGLATTDSFAGNSGANAQTILNKARVLMTNRGVPPRGDPAGDAREVAAKGQVFSSAYVMVCGPEVVADIITTSTSLGTWASTAMYNSAKALYSAEVGQWLNFRIVESNFLPRFSPLGTAVIAVASTATDASMTITAVGSGGTLTNATHYWCITRKDLTRGFEEAISAVHTTATGASSASFTFLAAATAGYVYNIYLGLSATTMHLVATNVAASSTSTITAIGTGVAPPEQLPSNTGAFVLSGNVYPCFIFGEEACNWVGFYGIKTYITGDISIPGNVLRRRRSIGYTFFGKAMIRDQERVLRLEVCSAIG